MPEFDFHTRRLLLRLRLIGSDPAASRALLRRWASASAGRARSEPDALRLPPIPLADLLGFVVEARVERLGGSTRWPPGADGCILVLHGSAASPHELRLMEGRARAEAGTGPLLWAAEGGWSGSLADCVQRLGVEDDALRGEVRSRAGALACLEVAIACAIDHAVLRVHPAAPGEGAPDGAALSQRLRAWTRELGGAGRLEAAALDSPALQAPRAAAPDEPWRRRALDLEGIEPLPSADAAIEIRALEEILNLNHAPPREGDKSHHESGRPDRSRSNRGRR
jgi:hypothetical protein